VAANSQLRQRIADTCRDDGLLAFIPSRAMCTDNAAMIGATAWYRLRTEGPSSLDLGAYPNLRLPLV
jgi:N6-L-threonylcarbamoyladenine synthase